MKNPEILELYNKMMHFFDDHLETRVISNVNDPLQVQKDIIREGATNAVPTLTIMQLYDVKNLTLKRETLFNTSSNAFHLASQHVKDISDSNTYKTKFRTVYATALRMELYRELIAKGRKETNPALIVNSLKTYFESKIEKFQAIEEDIPNMWSSQVQSLKIDLMRLIRKFEEKCNDSSPEQIHNIKKAALEFELEAITKVQQYRIKYESNISWGPFLKNLLPIITGIGVFFTLYSMAHKAITGRYRFFDRPYLVNTNPDDHLVNDEHLKLLKGYGFIQEVDLDSEDDSNLEKPRKQSHSSL